MNEQGSAFGGATGRDLGWGLLIVLGALFVAHALNSYVASVRLELEAETGQVETIYQEVADGE